MCISSVIDQLYVTYKSRKSSIKKLNIVASLITTSEK